MLNLFKRKSAEEADSAEPEVDPVTAEHQAFAQWLEQQPENRRQMYLNLAMSCGFREPAESKKEEESHE